MDFVFERVRHIASKREARLPKNSARVPGCWLAVVRTVFFFFFFFFTANQRSSRVSQSFSFGIVSTTRGPATH
eukprot:2956625-Prymnesium_polylepis.1